MAARRHLALAHDARGEGDSGAAKQGRKRHGLQPSYVPLLTPHMLTERGGPRSTPASFFSQAHSFAAHGPLCVGRCAVGGHLADGASMLPSNPWTFLHGSIDNTNIMVDGHRGQRDGSLGAGPGAATSPCGGGMRGTPCGGRHSKDDAQWRCSLSP